MIVDAHHHVWNKQDLPWLSGPERPRIFGAYGAIRRDYPIQEYLEDIRETGIGKSVYVQANWDPARFEDEVAWVQSVADDSGWPHAIAGYADFTVDDVRPQLDRLAGHALVRGVRQQFHWHEVPRYRFASRPDLAADATVQNNIRCLAGYGWCFELQVFSGQMSHAAELAARCPDVTFVLQHAGMLEDDTRAGRDLWAEGMLQLAACPNVMVKLSGFGTFLHRNDQAFIARMVRETVEMFGADRCMFGSNFPIEKLWTGMREIVDSFLAATEYLVPEQRDAIFRLTAERVYRL